MRQAQFIAGTATSVALSTRALVPSGTIVVPAGPFDKITLHYMGVSLGESGGGRDFQLLSLNFNLQWQNLAGANQFSMPLPFLPDWTYGSNIENPASGNRIAFSLMRPIEVFVSDFVGQSVQQFGILANASVLNTDAVAAHSLIVDVRAVYEISGGTR